MLSTLYSTPKLPQSTIYILFKFRLESINRAINEIYNLAILTAAIYFKLDLKKSKT